jgi:hypothetical protein
VVATRLIRVTGDCLGADRVLLRFVAAVPRADFFAADFDGPVFRALVFATLLLRAPARFVALGVFRRAFPPDDFGRVAIFSSSLGRYDSTIRKIRARRRANISPLVERLPPQSQNHALVAHCNLAQLREGGDHVGHTISRPT